MDNDCTPPTIANSCRTQSGDKAIFYSSVALTFTKRNLCRDLGCTVILLSLFKPITIPQFTQTSTKSISPIFL